MAQRPLSTEDETKPLHIRATATQLETWAKAARAEGRNVSSWVRATLDEKAKRLLGRP